MNLVDDWKAAWTWFSTWLLAMNGTFIVAYENFDSVKAYIPDKWAHRIIITLLVLTFLAKLIKQKQADAKAA